MYSKHWKLPVVCFLVILVLPAFSQKNSLPKYPSLFWEITGNGLQKPSYLFGTMHVSSKMVFHLSDSFYLAIKNVETVALELNPDVWQGQMVRLDHLKQNYSNFVQVPGGDYLTESSFRVNNYEDELKTALSSEPTIINGLLYRTYKTREDFEEDTFLDLYIFQTGKKLGKRTAGVENYYETEKIVLEAYADMTNEKKKKKFDTDGESMRDIEEKMQDAYRRGDLDLLDSLDILTERSDAFREKFLYKRNEIQANSIDTIIKKSSLFVGIGAAHLSGQRGVIELLRKKGYRLRPIKIIDRDAVQKDETDKLKAPVVFSTIRSDDGFYTVDMPGPLYKMTDEYQKLDRRQYADMSNGSYYLVTRVTTHAAFNGQSEELVKKKTDSLLYENIPGKIIQKIAIEKNGYKGFDITNKTRRGDLQRYQIFITPFEVLIFKMSGKENYVEGKEAAHFFSSIRLKETDQNYKAYSPAQGGFSVRFPQTPNEHLNTNTGDGSKRWEYESIDNKTGDAYLLLKKSVYNFKFLEEDSFDLKFVEESFRSADIFDKQTGRELSSFKGYPCLNVKEVLKDGSYVNARYIIKGPHYFVIAVRSKNRQKDFSDYFNSFDFVPYNYQTNKNYTDTFMHFSVSTPVMPEFDDGYRSALEKASQEVAYGNAYSAYNSYWPRARYALFESDSTGEVVGVTIQEYPKYYYVKDSSSFWNNQINEYYDRKDLVLYKKDSFFVNNILQGFHFILRDTGSSRTIERKVILKDDRMYSLVTQGDTLNHASIFTYSFFKTFATQEKKQRRNIFVNCLDSFFADLSSSDSARHTKAQQSISNIYFGEKGIPGILKTIYHLKPTDKDYFDTKSRLISELGFIKDSSRPQIVGHLKQLYEQATDTSTFQNQVILALAKHKTTDAITVLKKIVLQDPPIFENSYDYTTLFNRLEDSLLLAKNLYPEILQLTTLDDYKEPVTALLATLVDSDYIKAADYENYFNKLYFDARIALKKQLGKDEKKMEKENNKDDNDDPVRNYHHDYSYSPLTNYAILMLPFYSSNASIPKFFDKLLQSKDEDVQLNAAELLLRNNKPVTDSLLLLLASKDQARGKLFSKLEKAKRLDVFPKTYKTQIAIARSYLVADKGYDKMDTIAYLSRQTTIFNGKKGMVYFFKYRVKKEDDWKIGISGLQPADPKEVSSNNKLAVMTDKKLKADKPVDEQLQEQLKRVLFTFHKSARKFFENDGNNFHFKPIGEYGE